MGNICSCDNEIKFQSTLTLRMSNLERANPIVEENEIENVETNSIVMVLNSSDLSNKKSVATDADLIEEKKNIFKKSKKQNQIQRYSLFGKENFKKNLKKNIFDDDKFRKKLLKSAQIERHPNSKLIHLKELMIPFSEKDDLKKIQDRDYIQGLIKEIQQRLRGKYLIIDSYFDIASKENIIKYMSSFYIEENYNNNSFYLEDNIYVGINFKIIDCDTFIIYYLYAKELN